MRRGRSVLAAAAALLVAVFISACGSSSTTSGTAGSGAGTHSAHGPVAVLYAGSLVNLMEHDLGPAFTRADGYAFEGFGAGSKELVAQIKSGVRQGDVFISASPKANKGLVGAANGNWESWYITFARAPLVIGYNPSSKFAAQLRSKPWYQVITEPGIRVGRTDPKLDPKGTLTVEALKAGASSLHMPSLTHAIGSFSVFPEESLVGRLEAGQLDAGFFYVNEAKEQHIPTVSLAPVKKGAEYTVTILRGAPHAAGAQAFVRFLLSAAGRATLAQHGLVVLAAKLTGSAAAVPRELRALVGG